MHKILKREDGMVSMESAIFLPFIALLIFVLVEGVNTISAYSTIAEASRSAARHIALTDDTSGADAMVKTLIKELPPEAITTNVTVDDVNDKVTVEVLYQYNSLFTARPMPDAVEGATYDGVFTLKAQTTMPMP